MRIPLDHYRILGVPCQATDEQIAQAHGDRRRQLPHQGYSERAIAERNELLDEAYRVLSAADSRSAYDARFLERTNGQRESPSASVQDLPTPSLEIEHQRLAGALSILLELGEYELVTRLGEEYRDDESLAGTRDDILLTIALAYLELSGERWQEKEYERASERLVRALELLEPEKLFPAVVREIHHDFYRLRPYRILELLSRELGQTRARSRGLVLLSEILDERGGIDGEGNDRSGLGIDDFLRFIQQLRAHLTLDEQRQIFEKEARRLSAVGEYLQVYVLMAKGFAGKHPPSIVQAIDRLERLQKHQDVSLERAICALLLGQVDVATVILEKSQEKNIVKNIQERSPDAEDLLPGLCDYGERWLRTEVCDHFRDLVDRPVSLKDYFADETVQNYLEELSKFPNKKSRSDHIAPAADPLESEVSIISVPEPARTTVRGVTTMSETAYSYSHPRKPSRSRGSGTRKNSSLATARNLPSARGEYPETGNDRGTLMVTAAYRQPPVSSNRRRPQPERAIAQQSGEYDPTIPVAIPRRRPKTRRRKLRLDRVAILAAGVVGTLVAMGFGVKAIVDSRSPLAALSGEPLSIELNTPLLEIPSIEARAIEPATVTALTKETGTEIIRSWLAAKADALGSDHQTVKLNEVLVDPALTLWQNRANALKGNNYWKYDHQIEVRSVMVNPKDPNQGTIEAKVREKARYLVNGKDIANHSYDDTIKIHYDLVRQGDKWLIQNTKIVK